MFIFKRIDGLSTFYLFDSMTKLRSKKNLNATDCTNGKSKKIPFGAKIEEQSRNISRQS